MTTDTTTAGPCACGRFQSFPAAMPPLADGTMHVPVMPTPTLCEVIALGAERSRLAAELAATVSCGHPGEDSACLECLACERYDRASSERRVKQLEAEVAKFQAMSEADIAERRAAERARDEALALVSRWEESHTLLKMDYQNSEAAGRILRRERDEQARLRQIAEDAIPKGLAVGMEFVRAEAARERDEAVAALRDVADFGPFDFAQAVEWCWCGDADPVKEHQPYCLRARRVLAASTGERKSGPAEPDVPR